MTDSIQTPHFLPPWAKDMIALYESRAVNQFVLHGNVNDRLYLPLGVHASLGGIRDFLLRVLLPRFDVILSYDLGNGIRVKRAAKSSPTGREPRNRPKCRGSRASPSNFSRAIFVIPRILHAWASPPAGRLLRSCLSSCCSRPAGGA